MGRDIIPKACYGYYVVPDDVYYNTSLISYLSDRASDGTAYYADFKKLCEEHRVQVVEMGRCDYPCLIIAIKESVVIAHDKFLAPIPEAESLQFEWSERLERFMYALETTFKDTVTYCGTGGAEITTEGPQWYFGFYDSY